MAVSNSFVIYQMHWESKQLRLSGDEMSKLKLHQTYVVLKKKAVELLANIDEAIIKPKDVDLYNFLKRENLIAKDKK